MATFYRMWHAAEPDARMMLSDELQATVADPAALDRYIGTAGTSLPLDEITDFNVLEATPSQVHLQAFIMPDRTSALDIYVTQVAPNQWRISRIALAG